VHRKIASIPMMIALFFCGAALAAGGLEDLARTALSGNPAESADAIDGLRQAGPAGMKAMLALAGSGDAVDRVCGVRDCADIRLFWYTELRAAKAAAQAEGKPILSLRLMGQLDEELSCANSRFFRTVFYKNGDINKLLRERFILHWRSVRPVPRVTIDFGNGSSLERTLTGNSIHYVLDSRGRLLEALPGLYGPDTFRAVLEEAAREARTAERLDDARLVSWAIARHERRLAAWTATFRRDLRTAPGALKDRVAVGGNEGSKQASEGFVLVALGYVNDDQVRELAQLRRPRIQLDRDSRAFLLRKHGVTDPREAERLVDSFETTLAADEVIGEYRLGPAILTKLSDPEVRNDFNLEAFNQWVYEEVFQTPLSDPWLGLAPEDVYMALPASTRTTTLRLHG
jgi:hypothetical protein